MTEDKARKRLATQVVRLRERKGMSWAQIGQEIDSSPSRARALYDLVKGEGAHHGLLPGKGGRLPAPASVPQAKRQRTTKASSTSSGKAHRTAA